MKLRYIAPILFQIWALPLFAMSHEEKAEFMRQLNGAQTSGKMEQLVKARLSNGTVIRLELYEGELSTIQFQIYGLPSGPDATQVDHDVCAVLEEAFFTDMHPFIFEGVTKAAALERISRYQWAREYVASKHKNIVATNIETDFSPIFDTHCSQRVATEPVTGSVALINQYNYARKKCAQYTGEDRLLGGKEWLSRKIFGYKCAALGVRASQITLFVGGVAVAVGAVYYLWNMNIDE